MQHQQPSGRGVMSSSVSTSAGAKPIPIRGPVSAGGPGAGASTTSVPIPISAAKRAAPTRGISASYAGVEGAGFLSTSVPAAPVIGSLKAPSALEKLMPDFSLPPASPEAFSMAASLPESAAAHRHIGAASAPARSFMDQAARVAASSAGVLGTSPTVLSVLGSRGTAEDSLARMRAGVAAGSATSGLSAGLSAMTLASSDTKSSSPFAKEAARQSAGVSGVQEGGLSAMLKTGAGSASASAVPAAGVQGSGVSNTMMGGGHPSGGPVILSASFRDPSSIVYAPIDEDDGETREDLQSSDDEPAAAVRAGRGGIRAHSIVEAEDEDEQSDTSSDAGRAQHRALSDGDDGVFQAEFE